MLLVRVRAPPFCSEITEVQQHTSLENLVTSFVVCKNATADKLKSNKYIWHLKVFSILECPELWQILMWMLKSLAIKYASLCVCKFLLTMVIKLWTYCNFSFTLFYFILLFLVLLLICNSKIWSWTFLTRFYLVLLNPLNSPKIVWHCFGIWNTRTSCFQ